MFARLTNVQFKINKLEEAVKAFKESIVPETTSLKGSSAAYLLMDKTTGDSVIITFWDSEEDAFSNEANRDYQRRVAEFSDLFKSYPILKGYEVVVV